MHTWSVWISLWVRAIGLLTGLSKFCCSSLFLLLLSQLTSSIIFSSVVFLTQVFTLWRQRETKEQTLNFNLVKWNSRNHLLLKYSLFSPIGFFHFILSSPFYPVYHLFISLPRFFSSSVQNFLFGVFAFCLLPALSVTQPPIENSILLTLGFLGRASFLTRLVHLCNSLICHEFHPAPIPSQLWICVVFSLYLSVLFGCSVSSFSISPVPGGQVLLDGFIVSICREHRSLLCISWVARINQLLLTFLRTLSFLYFLLLRIRLVF